MAAFIRFSQFYTAFRGDVSTPRNLQPVDQIWYIFWTPVSN